MFSSVTVFSFLQGTNPVNIFSIRLGVITICLLSFVCFLTKRLLRRNPRKTSKSTCKWVSLRSKIPAKMETKRKFCYLIHRVFFETGVFIKTFSLEHLLQRCPYCLSVTNRSFPFTSRTNLLIVKSEFHVLPQPRFSGELSTFIFPFLFFIILFIYSWLELLHLS